MGRGGGRRLREPLARRGIAKRAVYEEISIRSNQKDYSDLSGNSRPYQKGGENMRKQAFMKRVFAITLRALFAFSLLSLGLTTPSHAGQPAELAYDMYIGHLGVKNLKPPYIGEISAEYYDGISEDLLTAGLGKTGLAAAAPAFTNPLNPTPAELRRNAIHTNYRAPLDITANGGYGIVNLLLPSVIASGDERCASLANNGLVDGATVADQAASALRKLRDYGWLADSDALQLSHYAFASNAIAMTYSNALGRVSVLDNLCGYSFANTNPAGDPIPQVPAVQLGTFSTGNGVPPTSGVSIVYNLAGNSTPGKIGKRDILASSPSTGILDLAFNGAVCHRNLIEAIDIVTGHPLAGDLAVYANGIKEGIKEAQLA